MSETSTMEVAEAEPGTNGKPIPGPVVWTQQDIENLARLVTVGAKAMSSDKPLGESVQIQTVGAELISKIANMKADDGNANA